MTLADTLIVGLAAWRVAHFMVYEAGPGGIMRWLRELAGMQYDDDGLLVSYPETFPATLLVCIWCTSAWTAVVGYAVWVAVPTVVMVAATWGAASAMGAILERVSREQGND